MATGDNHGLTVQDIMEHDAMDVDAMDVDAVEPEPEPAAQSESEPAGPSVQSTRPDPNRPLLFVIYPMSLGEEVWARVTWEHLLKTLKSKADLVVARESHTIRPCLEREDLEEFDGVVVFGPEITHPDYTETVSAPVFRYLHLGGSVIFCGTFPILVEPDDMNRFFRSWNLPWRAGWYGIRFSFLNPECPEQPGPDVLREYYHIRGRWIENVPRQEAWYLGSTDPYDRCDEEPADRYDPNHPGPPTHSHPPIVCFDRILDERQAIAALTPVGEGWLGYVGDAEADIITSPTVVAMLDL